MMIKYFGLLLAFSVLTGCQSNIKGIDQSTTGQYQTENLPSFVIKAISHSLNKPMEEVKKEDYSKVEELYLRESDLPPELQDKLIDLSFLSNIPKLKSLSINKINAKDYLFLSDLKELESLSITGFKVNQLPVLSPKLNNLTLEEGDLSDLSIIKHLELLQYLTVRHNKIKDISPIQSLRNLIFLDVSNNPLHTIDPVKEFSHLERLQLMNTTVTDITVLSSLSKLRFLDIRDTNVESVKSLSGLTELTILLANPKKLKDINFLNKKVKVAEDANYINDGV